jgi:hypothetical protein
LGLQAEQIRSNQSTKREGARRGKSAYSSTPFENDVQVRGSGGRQGQLAPVRWKAKFSNEKYMRNKINIFEVHLKDSKMIALKFTQDLKNMPTSMWSL